MASQVFSADGHTYAINSSGTGYSYNDYPTNTRTPHPEWGVVYELQTAGDGNLYGLQGSCASTGHYFSKWNGTGWSSLGWCVKSFSVDPTGGGMVLMIGTDSNTYKSTDYGLTLSAVSSCTGGVLSVAAMSSGAGRFAVICSVGKGIYVGDGSTFQQTSGAGLAVTSNGSTMYVTGTDNTVYDWKGTFSSNDWYHLYNSPATSIADGGSTDVWAVGNTSGSNNLYRFSENGLQWTRSYSGSVGCAPGVLQALCNTFTHSASLRISVQGHEGTQPTQQFNGAGSWGLSSIATANDIFFCLENDPECTPVEESGSMQCSGGGSNTDQPFLPRIAFERAFSRAKLIGTATWSWATLTYVYGPLASECTVQPDDADITSCCGDYIRSYSSTYKAFDVNPLLFSLNVDSSGQGHQPWFRLAGNDVGGTQPQGYLTDPGPRTSCTVTP